MTRERDGWQLWMQNGRLATVAWVLVFITYVIFRAFKINDPAITNAFVTMTGIWVGNLGIAQGKKVPTLERKVERLQETAVRHHPEEAEGLTYDD